MAGSVISRQRAVLVTSVIATLLAIALASSAHALEYTPHNFCSGPRTANTKCEGPRGYPWDVEANSTTGGWSWAWVWNEKWGSDSNECQIGNCLAHAKLGGEGYGKVQMENASGKTYDYEAYWYGKE